RPPGRRPVCYNRSSPRPLVPRTLLPEACHAFLPAAAAACAVVSFPGGARPFWWLRPHVGAARAAVPTGAVLPIVRPGDRGGRPEGGQARPAGGGGRRAQGQGRPARRLERDLTALPEGIPASGSDAPEVRPGRPGVPVGQRGRAGGGRAASAPKEARPGLPGETEGGPGQCPARPRRRRRPSAVELDDTDARP